MVIKSDMKNEYDRLEKMCRMDSATQGQHVKTGQNTSTTHNGPVWKAHRLDTTSMNVC